MNDPVIADLGRYMRRLDQESAQEEAEESVYKDIIHEPSELSAAIGDATDDESSAMMTALSLLMTAKPEQIADAVRSVRESVGSIVERAAREQVEASAIVNKAESQIAAWEDA